tara:strand:+ start:106 stop:456 length:351 start_codon:yes stop_codon:yes gene_type:complete
MKKLLALAILSLTLVSCAMTEEERLKKEAESLSKMIEEQKRIVQKDKATCKNYGFDENTQGFSNCLMQLDISRKEEAALKKVLRCQRIKQANNNPNKQSTGFWGGVLEGLSESGCD